MGSLCVLLSISLALKYYQMSYVTHVRINHCHGLRIIHGTAVLLVFLYEVTNGTDGTTNFLCIIPDSSWLLCRAGLDFKPRY